MIDWGVGEYERTAEELWPAAEEVIRLAAVQPGEAVVDIGCGTGNAALLAARAGAAVTGVDPAARLLDVARERFDREELGGEFLLGEAGTLPCSDHGFDVVLPVFGVIFAPHGEAAAAEIMRVMRPSGRAFVSAWGPEGGIHDAIECMTRGMGVPAPPAEGRSERGVPKDSFQGHEAVRLAAGDLETTFLRASGCSAQGGERASDPRPARRLPLPSRADARGAGDAGGADDRHACRGLVSKRTGTRTRSSTATALHVARDVARRGRRRLRPARAVLRRRQHQGLRGDPVPAARARLRVYATATGVAYELIAGR